MGKTTMAKSKPSKSVMKQAPLKKGGSSGSKDKKGKPAQALNKKSLQQGPQPLSLQEKVKKALSECETPESAAFSLKDQMSKVEKSTVWSQYQTHLKHNKEDKEQYDQMTNLEKGNAQALWFITKSAPKVMGMKIELVGKDRVIKKDEWCSLHQMLDKFGKDEMEMHIASGRLLWREDPLTKGVWEYKDQGAVSREITLEKGKTLKTEQEWEPSEEQDGHFKSLYDSDLLGMLGMTEAIFQSDNLPLALGKGKGKGSLKGLEVFGKGKRPRAVANENEPRTETEQLEDAVSKSKKMRDVCNKTVNELQLLIKDCKGTKFWSKAAQKDADNLLDGLKQAGQELQTVLLKKSANFELLKDVCLKAASTVKSVTTQMKEYKGLLHKTSSKASRTSKASK